MSRRYYSARTGKNPLSSQLDLPTFLRLFRDLYSGYLTNCYFQEAFGYDCVDEGRVAGKLGLDIEAQMLRRLRKANLWPVEERCTDYSEDDAFDVIEFVYDCISKPLKGRYHDWNQCGWHYNTFDLEAGRQEYLAEINELLGDYDNGYELSADGEILALAEKGLEGLFQAPLPTYDDNNVEGRVDTAALKFRRHRSSVEDRHDAVRDLADVLEFLRPSLATVLTKNDEADLFNIANNFGIRHHNDAQKTDYDKDIWYDWMFYYYLSAIHAVLRLIKRDNIDKHLG